MKTTPLGRAPERAGIAMLAVLLVLIALLIRHPLF